MRYTPDDRLQRAAHLLSRTTKQICPWLNTPCMLWLGPLQNGHPRAKVRAKDVKVRRYVYETFRGQAFGYLKTNCGQALCINPDHQREA